MFPTWNCYILTDLIKNRKAPVTKGFQQVTQFSQHLPNIFPDFPQIFPDPSFLGASHILLALRGRDEHRPSAIAKEDAGATVRPVDPARETWSNPGILRGFHWDFTGISMAFLGFSWDFSGISCDFDRVSLWMFIGFHWILKGFHGISLGFEDLMALNIGIVMGYRSYLGVQGLWGCG